MDVSGFVKEVNRGRVIMVGTIATTTGGPADAGHVSVASGTALEEAAKTMTDANQQYATVVEQK